MSLRSDITIFPRVALCLLVLVAMVFTPVSAVACGMERDAVASCCCGPSHAAPESCGDVVFVADGCRCQMSPAQPASPAAQAVAAGGLKAPRLAPQFALAEMVSLLALDAPRVVPQRLATPVGPPTPVDQFFRINC